MNRDVSGVRSRDWAEFAAAFADTCRMPTDRIPMPVTLPIAPLDGPALQERLDSMGRTA